jgi:hypothetical protein
MKIDVALAMIPLLERGTEALRAKFAHLAKEDRPIGLSVEVVLEADFVAYPALVLQHVCKNVPACHVLCADDSFCLLIGRYPGSR